MFLFPCILNCLSSSSFLHCIQWTLYLKHPLSRTSLYLEQIPWSLTSSRWRESTAYSLYNRLKNASSSVSSPNSSSLSSPNSSSVSSPVSFRFVAPSLFGELLFTLSKILSLLSFTLTSRQFDITLFLLRHFFYLIHN